MTALVAKAIQGDESAFVALYTMYAKKIRYHTGRIIRNYDDADDAAQEVVIAMHNSIKNLRDPETFLPWMYKVTKYVCYHHIRKLKSEQDKQDIKELDKHADTLIDNHKDSNPAVATEEKDRNAAIMRVINNLPEKQQEAIILYYFDEMNYREIAEAIGSTVSSVSTNIMKAKRNICNELKKKGNLFIASAITADMTQMLRHFDLNHFQSLCSTGLKDTVSFNTLTYKMMAGATKTISPSVVKILAGVAALVVIFSSYTIYEKYKPDVSANSDIPKPQETVTSDTAQDADVNDRASGANATTIADEIYKPDAKIILTDGDCQCGHVNPKTATLQLDDVGTVTGWKLIDANGDIRDKGSGADVGTALQSLPLGEYSLSYALLDDDGDTATASRKINIISGEIDPNLYE
ncbi:MAG: RNA polymerase sigma factor [Clostridiales Family XIII bacterium]|nr:RNA polymerase sigma factor [Clostridiales Family XIII bacterium]